MRRFARAILIGIGGEREQDQRGESRGKRLPGKKGDDLLAPRGSPDSLSSLRGMGIELVASP